MKAIVSHVKKQHAYRLVYALQSEKKLKMFYTAIFFKKNGLLKKIFNLSKKTKKLIPKRSFNGIENENVFLTILPEPFSILLNKMSVQLANYYAERLHDNIVSFLLNFQKYDVFIGYEGQALNSFKKAKQQGAITILDLASVHILKQIEINETYNNILSAFKKTNASAVMKDVKVQEFKYADYIITLSEFAKQSCLQYGVPESKIKVIPLGVDTKLFSPKENYDSNVFEIVFVAGVRYWKGIKDLMEVFQELNLKNSKLTIIGGVGDAVDYVKNNTNQKIQYIPHLAHDELKIFYQEASIFVLPTYMDSFGQVIFEAMSCGTPVITTTHSGALDIVIDNENGYIVAPADKEALKDKILHFYHNSGEIERMGRNARKSVESLTWESYSQNINQFMNEIMHMKSREDI
jgi:glycosyltransferase involved in cell wall biosynthesis